MGLLFFLSHADIVPNVTNTEGNTALHIASQKFGSHYLVRALIMIGVDPTIKNNDGKTATDIATGDDCVLITLSDMSPGLWQAVQTTNEEKVMKVGVNLLL